MLISVDRLCTRVEVNQELGCGREKPGSCTSSKHHIFTRSVIKEEKIDIPAGTFLPEVFETKAWYPQPKQPGFLHHYPSPYQALLITSKTHQPPLKANVTTFSFWDANLGYSRPSKAWSTNTKYPEIHSLPCPPPLFLLPRDASATTAGCHIDSCLGCMGYFVHSEKKNNKNISKIRSKMPQSLTSQSCKEVPWQPVVSCSEEPLPWAALVYSSP